jgi:hypothetical protein
VKSERSPGSDYFLNLKIKFSENDLRREFPAAKLSL